MVRSAIILGGWYYRGCGIFIITDTMKQFHLIHIIVLSIEGMSTVEHFVDQYPQCPMIDVETHTIRGRQLYHFGCRVIGGTTKCVCHIVIFLRESLGISHINEFGIPIRIKHDILRFQIPIYDTMLGVHILQRIGDAQCIECYLIDGQSNLTCGDAVIVVGMAGMHDIE